MNLTPLAGPRWLHVINGAGEVPVEIDYPHAVETQTFVGMRFTRREPIRSVRDQVMLTIRIPRAALPVAIEVDTTTGCARTELVAEDGVP